MTHVANSNKMSSNVLIILVKKVAPKISLLLIIYNVEHRSFMRLIIGYVGIRTGIHG